MRQPTTAATMILKLRVNLVLSFNVVFSVVVLFPAFICTSLLNLMPTDISENLYPEIQQVAACSQNA